ncbi:hypothetical protein [Carnobacterium maltaromaticum]|uniref:hypothetical protein n=1 Tax=Carnobacterium maltaromaticum TaxID=2751 RepID=UPI00295E25C8|nr:hypothetical protein [Carnobacterium maltaromaticum]
MTYDFSHYVVLITDVKLILDHTIMEFFNEDPKELGCSIIFVQDVMSSLSENVKTVIDIRDRNTSVSMTVFVIKAVVQCATFIFMLVRQMEDPSLGKVLFVLILAFCIGWTRYSVMLATGFFRKFRFIKNWRSHYGHFPFSFSN